MKCKVIIQKNRTERLQNKIAEKQEKELALTLEREKLTSHIEEIDGLWSTVKEAKKYLEKCYTKKERRPTLKTQLPFRLKVLGSSCDKSYFFL